MGGVGGGARLPGRGGLGTFERQHELVVVTWNTKKMTAWGNKGVPQEQASTPNACPLSTRCRLPRRLPGGDPGKSISGIAPRRNYVEPGDEIRNCEIKKTILIIWDILMGESPICPCGPYARGSPWGSLLSTRCTRQLRRLAEALCHADVILLQEVPKNVGPERVEQLIRGLREAADPPWGGRARPNRSAFWSFWAARTLNATCQSRVTLSLW